MINCGLGVRKIVGIFVHAGSVFGAKKNSCTEVEQKKVQLKPQRARTGTDETHEQF